MACFPDFKPDVAAAGYELQQQKCVDDYADREHIDACRAKVKAAWLSSDAGKESGK